MTLPVTAIVLTKNEELSLPNCLKALGDFAQVIVVDSASDDRTVEIAASAGAEVVDFKWNGQYPKKKQWAMELSQIRFDWVLFVDADERPDAEFLQWLAAFVTSPPQDAGAADVILRYRFLGRELRHGHRVVKRALVHRRRARFPVLDDLHVKNMWEVEGHYQPYVEGRVVRASGGMRHEDEDSLFDWFARHNRYSDWEAAVRSDPQLNASVQQTRTGQGKVFSRLPLKPLIFFVYAYVLRAGFRDGRPGFFYALALACYYAMIDIKSVERELLKKVDGHS